jgi:hypothetical protein
VSDASIRADKELHAAVEQALDAYGLTGGLLTTDIIVIVAQRGFDEKGGTSRVTPLVTTDTPHHVLLGMLGSMRIRWELEIRESFGGGEDG